MLPFRFGSASEFAAVRDLFAASDYTAAKVCERCQVEEIYELRTMGEGRETATEIGDALDVLIRLFIDGQVVPAPQMEALLPPGGTNVLSTLGLVDRHPRAPDHFAASLHLYPTEGLYIASDLECESPGLANPVDLEPADHVFSAITTLTGAFLRQLPHTPCERFLELCAGTGIAALIAARFCDLSWAVDITERSTQFAGFNARLNGIENFTALRGDLYAPVSGMTFDRIVAHPPYVPSTETQIVYRDGGEDGEEVIRRIIQQLPDYLNPGGRFYLTCAATDRTNAPLEQRIRDMLGDRQEDFDLLLVTHYALPPAEYYGRLAASGRITFATAEERTILFRELGAERIVYSGLVLQRHAEARAPFTLRREATDTSGRDETDWFLRWSTRMANEDITPMLLDSRPRLLPNARLHVTHRVENGEWKVDSSKVVVEQPFMRTVDLSLNAAMLLTLCDGEHSVREILQRVQAAGAIPAEVPPESFAEFIRELVSEGVVGLGDEPWHQSGASVALASAVDA